MAVKEQPPMLRVGTLGGTMPVYLNPAIHVADGYAIVTKIGDGRDGQYHMVVLGPGGLIEQRYMQDEIHMLAALGAAPVPVTVEVSAKEGKK